MKQFYKIFLVVATCVFTLASCNKEVPPHQPGEPDVAGCYGVYFPSQVTSVSMDPSAPAEAFIKVARTNSHGAITVPYEFIDEAGVFSAGDITFADGQSETDLRITFDTAEVGLSYSCSFEITDNQYVSIYSTNPTGIKYTITRDKWNSLGMAQFEDWFFANGFVEAEILQNDKDKRLLRLRDPYTTIFEATGDYPSAKKHGPSEFIEMTLLQPGDMLNDTQVTQKGLVYFKPYYSGYYYADYADEVKCYHPSAFSSYQGEAYWAYSKVLQYQDNGLPAAIQLAPYYYMDSVGGWDYTTSDNIITIIFPGAVLTDYSLSLAAGLTQDGVLPVSFNFGADVAAAKYAIYEGSLTDLQIERKAEDIKSGAETNVQEVREAGVENIELPTTGMYTLVAVSYSDDQTPQMSASVTFPYVAKGDEVPVIISSGLVSTNKYTPYGYNSDVALEAYLFGQDLVEVKMALFLSSDVESHYGDCLAVLDASDPVNSETLAQVNGYGYSTAYVNLTPGTEYTFMVYASNGFASKYIQASAKTTGMLDLTLEDVYGVYEATCNSYWNGPTATVYAIEPSNEPEYGNIMFTAIDGFLCDTPVYAHADIENALITIYSEQPFYYVPSWEGTLYFVCLDKQLEYYVESTTLDITNVGTFANLSNPMGFLIIGGPYDNQFSDLYTSATGTRVALSLDEYMAMPPKPQGVPYAKPEKVAPINRVPVYTPSPSLKSEYQPQAAAFRATGSTSWNAKAIKGLQKEVLLNN